MRRKVRQYFSAGAQVVWLVYPNTREVEVWDSASGTTRILVLPEKIQFQTKPRIALDQIRQAVEQDVPGLLPGFSIPVKSIF